MDYSKSSIYYILDRQNGNLVTKFEMPSHYVFHYFNAWEDYQHDDKIIKIYGFKYDIINISEIVVEFSNE